MALETYDLCPGGTGKKIKFCGCKDIVHELDKAISAIEGDQRAAALTLLDRLLEKHPERACVLALKAGCQFAVDDFETAETTVARFIAHHPDNPLALSQSAILHAVNADLDQAVAKVQRALEYCDDSIPYTVHEAIGIIGRMFVQGGDVVAARAHLIAHAALSDEEDTRSAALLIRLHSLRGIPALLKEDFALEERPRDVAWGGMFDEAVELAERAAWLAAVERLERIVDSHPHEAALRKNIAILYSWLGRRAESVAAWRAYAQLDGLALDDAVEAEATAQLVASPNDLDLLDVVSVTYPIRDVEKLMERVASEPRFELLSVDPREESDGQPPPKAVYAWLDRPQPSSLDGITASDVPRESGQFLIFGRETDREPRLELFTAKDDQFEQACRSFTEELGDLIDPKGEQEVVRREARIASLSNPRFRFPAAMSLEQRMELHAEFRRDFQLNTWPTVPQSVFEGRGAEDVAGDPAFRIRLLAAILISELRDSTTALPPLNFNQLRDKLKVPRHEKIDPWTISDVTRCPLVRLPRIDVLKLADDDLVALYLRAGRSGAREAVLHLAAEIERRPSLDDKVDKVELYELLGNLTDDNEQAFSYIHKARELAVASGTSGARWSLLELEMRLRRGEPDGVQELLRTIERKYIKEPGVGQELMQILVDYGVINPDGSPTSTARAQPAGVAAESSDAAGKIWTPESDSPSGGQSGESKLWLPGMD